MTIDAGPRVVSIVGAGTIGLSWAGLFAFHGWDVRLFDTSAARRDASVTEIGRIVGELDTLHPALASADAVSRVTVADSLAAATQGTALVLENLPENLAIKRGFYDELVGLVPADALLASSTSALPPSALFEGLGLASRALVAHPLNPPHLLPVVELVPSPWLTDDALADAKDVFAGLRMTPVVCLKEEPGFLANRLQYALFGEALRLLQDGVASMSDIDAVIRDGLGPRWALLGPFGVEASNAESVEDNYIKYGGVIRDLVTAVAENTPNVDDDALAALIPLTRSTMALEGKELIDYRRASIADIQRVKQSQTQPYRGETAASAAGDINTKQEEDMTIVVTHRHYIPDSQAHYGGGVLSGGYIMECFSDVATEICIRNDATEGLFASYSDVQFRSALYGGDIVEVTGRLTRVGTRSRGIDFELSVVARRDERDSDESRVLETPVLAATASGTVVVPARESEA